MESGEAATARDLEYLRRGSLRMVLIFAGIVLYFWCIALFQITDLHISPNVGRAVIGPFLLGSGLALAFALHRRRASLAGVAAMAGIGAAIVYQMYDRGMDVAPYLLTVVVSVAALLFGIRTVIGVTTLCAALVFVVGWSRWGHSPLSAKVLSPVFVISVVGLLAFLMVRNLFVALYWALDRAMAAERNENEARVRRGELVRTVKALREAYQRLEYVSYDLARARDAAEEAKESQQRFAATISHEMRTPLNVLTALSEMMYLSPERYNGAQLPAEFRRDAREIYRSSSLLLRLIEDMLDMTRMESGHMRVSYRPLDLSEVVEETLDMIRPLLLGRNIVLTAEVPNDLPLVFADRDRVQQVLLNLLNNAQRYTESGKIAVYAAAEDARVKVTVADTGVGIPPEAQSDIFREFYQIEGLVAQGKRGHGLGLAVCKRLVEMHGGRIWVESDGVPGHGSRFHFTLPTVGVETSEPGELVLTKVPDTRPEGRGRSLLFVGQDPGAVRLMELALDDYRVVSVDDLNGISTLITTVAPQAVVINSALGTHAGRRLGQVRQHLGHGAPIVVLCPLVTESLLKRSLGVVEYVIKPVTPQQLWTLLDRIDGNVRRILVVDDDQGWVDVLANILQSSGRGYEVTRAYDGDEGLQQIRLRPPDLVFLDLNMPRMDGYTLLEQMRADSSIADIPVVVITARSMSPNEERLLSGNTIQLFSRDGFSNRQAMLFLKAILQAASSSQWTERA